MEVPSKPKRIRPPKPRTPALRRGQACLNCRHLKIRCDGVRPVCGYCTRVPRLETCTFDDLAPAPPQSTCLDSHYSHCGVAAEWHDETSDSSALGFPNSPPASLFTEQPSDTQEETWAISSVGDLQNQEPHLETINVLLECFIPHAVQLGFFLQLEGFRRAALLPQILFNNIIRPAPSLLYAVYVWGAHLSQSGSLLELEPIFLQRALQYVSTDICAQRNAIHSVQTIQAHVLLSNYFLFQKQFLAARFHANCAATLTLAYHLHKLGSPPDFQHRSPLSHLSLGPAQNQVEQGERVRGFWAVVSLQAALNLAGNSPSDINSCILEVAGTEITTPWPMQMTNNEMQAGDFSALEPRGGEKIQKFLMEELQYSTSPSTANAQAAILLHRASCLAAKWSSHLQHPEFSTYLACSTWLNTRISQFRQTLPLLSPTPDPELVRAHALAAAASITANRTMATVDTEAQKRCMSAARAILQHLGSPTVTGRDSPSSPTYADPIYATICFMACRVLVDEIQSVRVICSEWARTLNIAVAPGGENESMLCVDLNSGMMILGSYAVASPLAEHYLVEIQQEYNSLYETL
ncbi:hypothetical protein B0H11DRAFT_1791020 [Mycena galericulata]|nr:hypothetical protein B0H11DRAFT_1791020 [Mycena galericulata]